MSPQMNRLLAELPDSELKELSNHLELVTLHKGQTLFKAGEIPAHVYFPVGAMVSMLNDMADGIAIETHTLGNACMVGVGAMGHPSFYRASVRSSGFAYRMSVAGFLRIRANCPEYVRGAIEAMQRMLMQLSQAIACSKRHAIQQQLIRWILIAQDCTLTHRIEITHQELAEIMGFRREAITLALGKLTHLHSIKIGRGMLEVIDREVLERSVCECYWIGQQRIRPDFQDLVRSP